ncbi:Ankyrin repeat domain containing protein [Pandoravirus salinus]|uniref:Ankyrin repeat domain containing protein n=1 Tax=Pandoravirus salinus TaxID=1349410 RepID=S4VWN1_9VIRU|nr:ankyrin repeat domain [Pandoravirus salinus]AGO84783.1 Ankyrin repeat domain containing protein [Pandoravirus salinus]
MQTLPTEIVDLVLDFVGPLPHARAVCRQWSAIIDAHRARHPKRRLSTNMYMDLLGEHDARSVIEWTRDNGCRLYASACAGAARRGHLALLQWLRASGCPWHLLTYPWAVICGHADIVAWLANTDCPMAPRQWWHAAILGGRRDVIAWLDARYPWPTGSCCDAARAGHVDILQMAKSSGVDCSTFSGCSGIAAKKGNIRVLESLRDHGGIIFSQVLDAAAWSGRLDVVQWVVAQGKGLCVTTMVYAAGGGHRHIIEWLRDQGKPWYGATTGYAAKYGHFDLLKWLYAQGCELSTTTFLEAVRGAPMPILEWLRDHQCPLCIKRCKKNARTDDVRVWLDTCGHLDRKHTGLWSRTIRDGDDDDDDSLNMP